MYDYQSTQINLPSNITEYIQRWIQKNIPNKYVYTDPDDDSFGVEEESHVTILYGLEDVVEPEKIQNDLQEKSFQPIQFSLEEIGMFENDKFDVLYLRVEGASIRHLHDYLKKNYPNVDSRDIYNPHCTLCYTKKEYHDEIRQFVGDRIFNSCVMTAKSFLFSLKGNGKREIRLIPEKQEDVE